MKAPSAAASRPCIMVIEDDRGIALGLRALLVSHGFQVDLVSAPEEAVRRLSERAYGLVVADFDLAGADGIEAIRRLRRLHPGIPVVAVTAVDREAALRAAADLPLSECFEKPVDPEELVQAVIRHAGRSGHGITTADRR